MPKPIVFFSRCRPQDADLINIVLQVNRAFIGWPAWRPDRNYTSGCLRDSIVDLACSEEEWQALLPQFGKDRVRYSQNRNLVQKVVEGSILLVPRPRLGVVFAGRVVGPFELINDPPWAQDYLRLRKEQGLPAEDEASHVADIAQSWLVDEFRPVPFPIVPAWIRASLFGRSTYGQIKPIEELGLDPYTALDQLIEHPEQLALPWTTDESEIERRLVAHIGPSTFEHLCVALLQLEHPDEIWAHVGGSGDGGVDGTGTDERGHVTSLLQCKWRYRGGQVSLFNPWGGTGDAKERRILAALLHGNNVPIPDGVSFWSRQQIVKLISKHASQLPLTLSMKVGTPKTLSQSHFPYA